MAASQKRPVSAVSPSRSILAIRYPRSAIRFFPSIIFAIA
jgi:hypothetical protein